MALLGLEAVYVSVWAYISFRLLLPHVPRDMWYPPLQVVGLLAGPFLFWALVGLGHGTSCMGWVGGLAVTGGLAYLTFDALVAASNGHGFMYWSFLTVLVVSQMGAFCFVPYCLVRLYVPGRRPAGR